MGGQDSACPCASRTQAGGSREPLGMRNRVVRYLGGAGAGGAQLSAGLKSQAAKLRLSALGRMESMQTEA